MPTCSVCHDLQSSSLRIAAGELQRNLSLCKPCSLLHDGIAHFLDFSQVSRIDLFVDIALYAKLQLTGKKRPRYVEYSTSKGSPTIWPCIGPGRDISADSSDEACIELAKSWLSNCVKNHPGCQRGSRDPKLPTRVIDVGSSDAEMHLYITNGAHGKYAALSYCWGKDSKQLITTTSTLALHEKAIVFDDVSKTMKEAAAVTRRLGLRYLWIDALCIIQDSAEDWETEAGRMSTVYRDAHITLSAAAAEATTQGLFPTAADRVLYNETCELLAPGPEEKDVNVRVRLRSESPSDLNSASHSSLKLPKPHISTRGWVLQEDILSHRILRFAKEEMYWLCSTQSRCECRLRPGAPQYNMLRQLKDDKLLDANSIHDLFVEWPLLVMELTHRSLTKETDRLHAISGLAAVIGEYTKDIYLAGLWASKLRNDLTWFVEESNGPNRRLTDPYAPSWSWASITGPVTYLGQYMTQFGVEHPAFDSRSTKIDAIGMADTPQYRAPLDIVDFAAHPTTSNKYGPVTSASIQIRGHILPVTYSTSTQLWQPLIPDLEYFYPDKFDVKYDVASEILQIQADAESTDAFCFLFVGITVSGFGLGTVIGHSVVCMLLQRVYKGQPVFRRCGLVFRAGYEEVWYKSIPRSTIVLV